MRSTWFQRIRARVLARHQIGLWHHPGYVHSQPESGHWRTQKQRAELTLRALMDDGLVNPRRIHAPKPVSFRDLGRVHTPQYLESVTNRDTLARILADEPSCIDIDQALKGMRLAVGGTVEAAEAVVARELRIAFNLGGGFHHAEPEQGAGFCVYNDIAVAIAKLRASGYHKRIAIVDLDYHQGNGNLAVFARDPTVLTYSAHGSVWTHLDAVARSSHLLPAEIDDLAYMQILRETLLPALEEFRPRLMFYVAGVDVLEGDPLGGFCLSFPGVFKRDRFVLGVASSMECPVVVTMAGGYRRDAWRSTATMIRWALTGSKRIVTKPEESLRSRFTRIAHSLDAHDLQKEASGDWALSEADIFGELTGDKAAHKVLGYYSVHGVELAFERYGILDEIRRRGFDDLDLTIDPSDPAHQKLSLTGRKNGSGPLLLLELVVRRRVLPGLPRGPEEQAVELLCIEWLLLQDPTASFTLERPQLAGQNHPGLGLAKEVLEVLYQATRRLALDGILLCPGHYHISILMADQFRFLDPRVQGRFEAMQETLSHLSVADASNAIASEQLRTQNNEAVLWEPGDYVVPVSPSLAAYFASGEYLLAVDDARRQLSDAGLVAPPSL